jgi:hypothetical protein
MRDLLDDMAAVHADRWDAPKVPAADFRHAGYPCWRRTGRPTHHRRTQIRHYLDAEHGVKVPTPGRSYAGRCQLRPI